MKNEDRIWELLMAYFSGNISDADRAFVDEWAHDDEHASLFEDARKIWAGSGIRLEYRSDSVKQLHLLRQRVSRNRKPVNRTVSLFRRHPGYFGIAAAFCVAMASWFVLRQQSPVADVVVDDDIVFDSGREVVTLYLPDSSIVWLNSNSSLRYPKHFSRRSIELKGEAFFFVRKDTVPFVITSSQAKTQVLGTSFNLLDRGDSIVSLTVMQGSVRFEKGDADATALVVHASEAAVIDTQGEIRKTKTVLPEAGSWRHKNNPLFERERSQPANYLRNRFSWRKNAINQSVIEGTLTNTALLAGYYKVVLEATYTRPDGKQMKVDHVINETISPGQNITYRKRILDILKDTRAVTVEVKSAQITTSNPH